MTHTYHVTLQSGEQLTYEAESVNQVAIMLFRDGKEIAGAKVQRVVEKYRGV